MKDFKEKSLKIIEIRCVNKFQVVGGRKGKMKETR